MVRGCVLAVRGGGRCVVVVDGGPVPYCMARIPQGGETRSNLAAGGRGKHRLLTESDWKSARKMGPTRKEKRM
ncbi:ATP-grasp domain-containing protein, partial [Escherichia coli]